jgi:hypothetical protein
VKTTVELDVFLHARLSAAAALRKCSRSTLAAKFIKAGLKGVTLIDKDGRKNLSVDGDSSDRQDEVSTISIDAETEAA